MNRDQKKRLAVEVQILINMYSSMLKDSVDKINKKALEGVIELCEELIIVINSGDSIKINESFRVLAWYEGDSAPWTDDTIEKWNQFESAFKKILKDNKKGSD